MMSWLVFWLIESMRPDTLYTVSELTGEQGSTKKHHQKHLKRSIDPNKATRTPSKAIEDIWVNAKMAILSVMKCSHLSASYQDAFCILSTGGGCHWKSYTILWWNRYYLKRPLFFKWDSRQCDRARLHLTGQYILTCPSWESQVLTGRKRLFEQHYPRCVFTGLAWYVCFRYWQPCPPLTI